MIWDHAIHTVEIAAEAIIWVRTVTSYLELRKRLKKSYEERPEAPEDAEKVREFGNSIDCRIDRLADFWKGDFPLFLYFLANVIMAFFLGLVCFRG